MGIQQAKSSGYSHPSSDAIGSIISAPGPPNRLTSLDGLRGIAAMIVVCHHFFCAFVPRVVPDLTNPPYWVSDTPVGIFINGAFSVSIFFVLSGFVVARAASKTHDSLFANILFRYLRLALPVIVSVIFAWGLLTLIPDAATRLNAIHASPWMTETFQHQIPGFLTALYHGALGAFGINLFHLNVREAGFNNALWTMRVELDGSLGIYLYYGIAKGWKRWIVLALIAFQTIRRPILASFIIGAVMMERWYSGKLRYGYAFVALVIGIILGFPGDGFAARHGMGHLPRMLMPGYKTGLLPQIAAALILYAVLNSRILDRGLSSRIPNFLGRVSFPLYLVHVPLLYTVFAALYVWVRPTSPWFVVGLFMIFLAASLLLAMAGEAWIDSPVLTWIGQAKKRWRTPKSVTTSEQQPNSWT